MPREPMRDGPVCPTSPRACNKNCRAYIKDDNSCLILKSLFLIEKLLLRLVELQERQPDPDLLMALVADRNGPAVLEGTRFSLRDEK